MSRLLKAVKLSLTTILYALSMFIVTVSAQSIDELIDAQKLTITIDVQANEEQVVGQALIVAIEVATDRWFATGSQVQPFNLTNVVMQANNISTINGSKRIKGKTWATQTHEITLYPTQAGLYNLPKFKVNVSVNTASNGVVSGVLTTNITEFNVTLPEELKGIEHFFVSPDAQIYITGEFNNDENYAIGDANTRTITVTSQNSPAMMIPEFKLADSNLSGISRYKKPDEISDKSNRGNLIGTRTETTTYIFEKQGDYFIPKQEVFWWNSEEQTLNTLIIPEVTWKVVAGNNSQTSGWQQFFTLKLNSERFIYLIVLVVIVLVITLLLVNSAALIARYKHLTHFEQRKLKKQFYLQVKQQKLMAAEQSVFHFAYLLNKQVQLTEIKQYQQLNELAYASQANNKPSRKVTNFNLQHAKTLINELELLTHHKNKKAYFSVKERVNFNIH